MGIKYSNNLLSVFEEAHDVTLKQAMSKAVDIADEALEVADEKMKDVIETTPSSIVDKDNRVDTGLMRDSVKNGRMQQVGKNHWVGEVGWISKLEDYFLTQEYGGKTPSSWGRLGGKTISPMHMLTQAKVELDTYLRERISNLD